MGNTINLKKYVRSLTELRVSKETIEKVKVKTEEAIKEIVKAAEESCRLEKRKTILVEDVA